MTDPLESGGEGIQTELPKHVPEDTQAVAATGGTLVPSYLVLVTATLGGQIIGLIGLALVARHIGPRNLGIYGVVNNLASYFVFPLMPGFALFGIREVAVHEDRRRATIAEVQILRVANGMLAYGALMLVGPLLLAGGHALSLLPIVALPLVINAVGVDWAMQGMQRAKPLAAIRFAGQCAYIIALVATLAPGFNGAKRYALCNALGFAVSAGLSVAYVSWLLTKRQASHEALVWRRNWIRPLMAQVKASIPMAASLIMIQVYYSSDVILLGYLDGYQAAGRYTVAARLPLAVIGLASLWVTVFFPHAARTLREEKKTVQRQIRLYATLAVLAGLPMVAVSLFLGPSILGGLFGVPYRAGAPAFAILMASAALSLVQGNVVHVLLAAGENRSFLISVTAGAIVNVILNLALIPLIGITGSAIATLAAECAVMTYAVKRLRAVVGEVTLDLGKLRLALSALVVMVGVLWLLRDQFAWWAVASIGIAAYSGIIIARRGVTIEELRRT